MQLRKRKAVEPYDLWDKPKNEKISKNEKKLHPSHKRDKKNPLPHPGQSYNPDPEDHKRLLQKVIRKELAYQRKEQSLRKAFNIKVSKKELESEEKKELESGIKHLITKTNENPEDSENSATDDAFSDYEDVDFKAIMSDKKVKEKRKSRQQRLKQLKDRLQRKAAKLRKLKNIRLSKFDAIKRMIKELDKKEKEEAEKMKNKKHKKIKNERLAQKFEPSDPIYCLSDELPSNLRGTKCPMDKLVREQLESFQSRLMVEPTSFQTKKRKYQKRQYDRSEA